MSWTSRFLAGGVFLVWGICLSYFYFSGRMASYLHPAFHAWTAGSGFVMLAIAVALVFLPSSRSESDERNSLAGSIVTAVALIVPLLGATILSPSEFGVTTVLNRGIIQSIGDLPAFTPPVDPPLPTQDGTVGEGSPVQIADYLARNEKGQILAETVDLLYAAAEPTIRQDFEDKQIEIIGQFLPAQSSNPDGDRFKLVRMFVMCCAADARPVAALVQAAPGTTFPDMTWLKITGRATFPMEGGRRSAVIVADSIEEIDSPPETFIY